MPRALLSVSDKTGLLDFARGLHALGWEIVSTGGTARALRAEDIPVREVSEVTRFPEMLDGRVKTLHPAVHGGLLARRDRPEHMRAIEEHGIAPIDLVAVNLYPFRETAGRAGVAPADVIEQIDIGGPGMLRSAAKNFAAVTTVVDPRHTTPPSPTGSPTSAPRACRSESPLSLVKARTLRYGENPGQAAAFYVEREGAGLSGLVQHGGKELSFNNLLDLEGALLTTELFGDEVCCAIIKHTTPCGLATGRDALDAYRKALGGDPVSAFGSVISFTVAVDEAVAEAVSSLFVECLVAPA